jgi:hypothetical protein
VKKLLPILSFFLFPFFTEAQSQISGYISLQYISGTTYKVTVTDYTLGDPANDSACGTLTDLDSLRLYYGDGTSDLLYRSNGNTYPPDTIPGGVSVCTCNKVNIYTSQHTFPGAGSYHIWFNGGARIANIVNMVNSTSTSMIVFNAINIGPAGDNITFPDITNTLACSFGCTAECYAFNPEVTAPAGDSISYNLANINAPGYFTPKNISLDSVTGSFSWCNPDSVGVYNFAMEIITYKAITVSGKTYRVPVDTEEMEFQTTIQSTCPSGINEITNSGGYTIYPNPANNVVHINGNDENSKIVTIYNIVGQAVIGQKEEQGEFSINTSGLANGIYFVNIKEESGRSYVMKLVKE